MADEARARRPHPVLVALAVVGGFFLATVICVLLFAGWAFRNVSKQFSVTTVGGPRTYLGQTNFDKAVAGIKIEGEIGSETTDVVLEKLEEARKDDRIAGILLEVNSPGGSVVSSQEIFDAVVDIRGTDKEAGKPVVVYIREVAASGAYYASASADRIIANRGSLVGSIGVIMQSFEAQKLLDWMKLNPVTLKTGRFKDTGSPLREWTPDDKAYLQKLIDDTRAQFVEDVKEGRELTDAAVNRMSDGRVVLGPEAVELKLVDALGTRDDAVAEIAQIAKLTETPELIYMEPNREFPDLLSEIIRRQEESLLQRVLGALETRQQTTGIIKAR